MMNPALPVFLAILLAALTAACFGSLPETAAPAAWPPANYREIIRDAQRPDSPTDESKPRILNTLTQVSELRKAVAPQSGDWVACLKSDTKPGFFAAFIGGQEVIDFRGSVQIDQCEFADYSPLTPLVLKRKKDNTKSK